MRSCGISWYSFRGDQSRPIWAAPAQRDHPYLAALVHILDKLAGQLRTTSLARTEVIEPARSSRPCESRKGRSRDQVTAPVSWLQLRQAHHQAV
jgi:hypothetical protein